MTKNMRITTKKVFTFEKGCEQYLRDCKTRNLREGTLKHYSESFTNLYKYIPPEMPISAMNKSTVDDLIIALRNNEKIGEVSLLTYTRDLKTLMYFFMRCDYIETFKIVLPSADRQPIEVYTDGELKKMLKKPNLKTCSFSEYKNWVIVNFLLSVGVRQRSLINIKIKDVDFENEVVYVNVTKNRKPIIIPLNQTMIKILEEYLDYREGADDDYLFCNSYGKQLVKSTVYGGLCAYNISRGVTKTGMHRFRHTFAKKWIMMGGNVVTLQKLLGHSKLDITQNYLNILVCDVKKEVDKYNVLQEFNQNYINMK